MWSVVDLGTKTSGALDYFIKRHGVHFPNGTKIEPKECLAVDRDEKYKKDVEEKGYTFMRADVLARDFVWPDAKFYTAFNFLEHLPSAQHSSAVLRAVLQHAHEGAWLRLPSFEEDGTGLGQLSRHGLRFHWGRWTCHRSAYKLQHVRDVAFAHADRFWVREIGRGVIHDSSDDRIVPDTAARNVGRYTTEMGPKAHVKFNPPLIAEWDVCLLRAI